MSVVAWALVDEIIKLANFIQIKKLDLRAEMSFFRELLGLKQLPSEFTEYGRGIPVVHASHVLLALISVGANPWSFILGDLISQWMLVLQSSEAAFHAYAVRGLVFVLGLCALVD